MTAHDSDSQKKLLDEVASGERLPNDLEVETLLQANPELRTAFLVAARVHDGLEQAGIDRREILENLASFKGAPGEDRIEALVHQVLGAESPEPRMPNSIKRRSTLAVAASLVAAAALVLLAGPFFSETVGTSEAPLPRLVLGANENSIQVDLEQSVFDSDTAKLVWSYQASTLGTAYQVVLFQGEGAERTEAYTRRSLYDATWELDSKELMIWNDCDFFRIVPIGLDGALILDESSALVPRSYLSQ